MNASALQAQKDRLTHWHTEQTAILGAGVVAAQRRVTDAQAQLEAAKKYLADMEATAASEKTRIDKHLAAEHASLDRQIMAVKTPLPWPVKS